MWDRAQVKISEMIAVLQSKREKFGDVEVLVTWEGQKIDLVPSSIYASNEGTLLVDADLYGDSIYREQFAHELEKS